MATYAIILAWKNPIDRGAWWATAHGVSESDTNEHTHVSFKYNKALCWLCCNSNPGLVTPNPMPFTYSLSQIPAG